MRGPRREVARVANKRSIGEWVRQNIVTVILIILGAVCFILSGETPALVSS